jgi:streptogramin lyase
MTRFITLLALAMGLQPIFLFAQPFEPEPISEQSYHQCGTGDFVPDFVQHALHALSENGVSERTTRLREFRLAFDVRYATLQRFNGDQDQVRWLIYQRVADLSANFERDLGIRLAVSDIHFWAAPDAYNAQNIFTALESCRNYWRTQRQHVERDVVVLYDFGLPGAQGYAYSFESCSEENSYLVSNSLSSLTIGYDNLLAHELGHILGSPHTHSCLWPGGPIDSCYFMEGSCVSNVLTPRTGYLMSYCTPDSRQFHPLAQRLIKDLAAKSEMLEINDAPYSPVGDYPAGHVTLSTRAAFFRTSPVPGVDMYTIELAHDPDFKTIVGRYASPYPFLQVYDLMPGKTYFWRAKAENDLGASPWGPSSQFYTAPDARLTASEPIYPLYEANVAVPHLKTFRFSAVPDAQRYKIRFYNQGFPEPEVWEVNDTFFNQRFYRLPGKQYTAWSVQAVFPGGRLGEESLRQVFLSWPDNTLSYPPFTGEIPSCVFPMPFRITSFPDTSWYQVQFSRSWDFSTIDKEITGIHPTGMYDRNPHFTAVNSVALSPSLPPGPYFYRLRQGNNVFRTDWSRTEWITVGSDSSYHFYNHQNTNLPGAQYNAMAINPVDGTRWLATTKGLYTAYGDEVKTWANHNDQPFARTVADMAFDQKGNLWTANTRQGISRYDGKQWYMFFIGFEMPEFMRASITKITPDERGGAFFTWGNNQVWQLLPSQQLVSIATTVDFGNQPIQFLQTDAQGILWLGTENRIFRYAPGDKSPTLIWEANAVDASRIVLRDATIAFDRDGAAWLPGFNGLARCTPDSIRFFSAPKSTGMCHAVSIAPNNDSIVWMSNGKTIGFNRFTEQWLELAEIPNVRKMQIDYKGRVWLISRNSNLLSMIDLKKSSAKTVVQQRNNRTTFEDTRLPEVRLWPNPVVSTLHVDCTALQTETLQLNVLDAQGQSVWQQTTASQVHEVPVSSWPSGVYRCVLDDGKGPRVVKTFVKNNNY